MSESLLLTHLEHHIATLVINRPAKQNSLSPALAALLLTNLQNLARNEQVRVVVIRGAGDRAFCAGYDIGSLPIAETSEAGADQNSVNPLEDMMEAVRTFPFPVIAMLNGHAFGAGCELSVCCDIRIGADDIRIGMPPAKLGLVYPWTGLRRFIAAIGLASTRRLFYSARAVQGTQLEKMGLVDILVPRSEIEAVTHQMAADIAANAPLALRGTKRVLNLIQQSTPMSPEAIAEAESLTIASFASQDLKEGQKAFLEKRRPVFEGK